MGSKKEHLWVSGLLAKRNIGLGMEKEGQREKHSTSEAPVVLTTKPAHMGPSLFYRQGSSEGQEKREKGGKPGIESRKLGVAFHRYGGPGILDADLWGADGIPFFSLASSWMGNTD
jgi:hypothetical protein